MRRLAWLFSCLGLSASVFTACSDDAFVKDSSSGASGSGGSGGATASVTTTSTDASSTDASATSTDASATATTGAGGSGGEGGSHGPGGTGGGTGQGGSGGGEDCTPKALDASATGQSCMLDTDCPAGYTCWTVNGFIVQTVCAILCADTCECPDGTACKLQSDKAGSWNQCVP